MQTRRKAREQATVLFCDNVEHYYYLKDDPNAREYEERNIRNQCEVVKSEDKVNLKRTPSLKSTILHDETKDTTGQNIFGFKSSYHKTRSMKNVKTKISVIQECETKSREVEVPKRSGKSKKWKILPGTSEDESLEDEPDSIKKRKSSKPLSKDQLEFVVNSDEYFRLGRMKSVTSNHTLNRLKSARLAPDQVRTILSKIKSKHDLKLENLHSKQQEQFKMWQFTLDEGYSLLLYGVGSKRKLMSEFLEQKLQTMPTMIVNGFFPSLTLKGILDSIVENILGRKPLGNSAESMKMIEKSFGSGSKSKMALVVNNLDGSCLKSSNNQSMLCRLARLSNIWFIASIDHINSPTLWTQWMKSQFNFTYWDCTSFLPYVEETSYEGSLLVQPTGGLVLSTLSNIFQSLTDNAQGIFMAIVKHQLEYGGKKSYLGMAFKDLYRKCRESLLVSSDQILRAQMTEFLDHKLVKSKRGQGGSEMLTIPLDDVFLQMFLEQCSTV